MNDLDEKNTQEIKKEVNELVVTTRAAVEEVNQNVQSIKEYYKNFEEVRSKIEADNVHVDEVLTASIRSKEEIDQLKISSNEYLDQIKTKIQTAEDHVKEMEQAYASFQEIKAKIDDPVHGLQLTYDGALSLKNQIEKLQSNSAVLLTDIGNDLAAIRSNIQEMEDAYTSFQEIKAKIDDPTSGLNALLGSATSLKNEITKTKAGIDESYREIIDIKKQSKILKERIEDDKQKTEEYLKKSEEYKTQIGKTLAIVTDSSLANTFKERKDELINESTNWLIAIAITLSLFIVYVLSLIHI